MATQFDSINVKVPKKHRYKTLSYTHKFTCNQGQLIPVYVQDVIPNDTFRLRVNDLIRFAPLVAPAMTEMKVYFHFFFVPNRLIWTNWETFMTGSRNGYKLSEEDIPEKPYYHFTSQEFQSMTDPSVAGARLVPGSLADYLGFQTFNSTPSGVNTMMTLDLDAMPFRVYNLIYSQYYRDENLTEDPWFNPNGQDWFAEDSGEISGTRSRDERLEFMQIRYRSWKKDYFTSALPWAQKGDDVLIPGSGVSSSIAFSTGKVPVKGYNSAGDPIPDQTAVFYNGFPNANTLDAHSVVSAGVSGYALRQTNPDGSPSPRDLYFNNNALGIDASALNDFITSSGSVSEGTIRELRRAMAAQRFLERRALGGSRYQEQNLAFFGIKGSDARLQRAEFLGGLSHHVMISQLLQTSQTTDGNPLGTPAGNAVAASEGFIFNRTFEEYGWIMGIMSIIPKATYSEGMPKMYLRKDLYDYYFPQFAQIGEQPIENQELYYNPIYGNTENSNNNNTGTFGYTPRYADYRFRNDKISGDFKSSLSFWTQARRFNSTPNLNQSFVECHPSNDIFAVTDENIHHCWCEVYFNVDCLRPVTKNVNPLL